MLNKIAELIKEAHKNIVEMLGAKKVWYCNYSAGMVAITFGGRMTKKTWKQGKYVKWETSNLLLRRLAHDVTLHSADGTIRYHFIPSNKEQELDDWIVYYNYNKE